MKKLSLAYVHSPLPASQKVPQLVGMAELFVSMAERLKRSQMEKPTFGVIWLAGPRLEG